MKPNAHERPILCFPTNLMTLVSTLLEIPSLRLRLHTREDLLDREVSRIYVTELPDPSRYLSQGEFVLSGLLWWREPGDAEPFVRTLADARCAGLAASGADTGGIPADLVEACRRHRIPLLEIPADLSFAVVTEPVVLALAEETGGARSRLLSAAADDVFLPVLLDCGATELGADCWGVTPTGRVVAGSAPEPPRRRGVRTVAGKHAVPSLVLDTEPGPAVRRSPRSWRVSSGWLVDASARSASTWNAPGPRRKRPNGCTCT